MVWVRENVEVALAVIVIVFLVVRPFLFQPFYIPSESMEPTLMAPRPLPGRGGPSSPGDRLLANVLLYRVSDPARGDIAIFKAPKKASPDEKDFVKRVIGIPGDTVEVIPPRLLLDGKPAVRLEEGNGLGGTLVKAEADGETSIQLTFREFKLRVLASPTADVRATPDRVVVDGKEALTDPDGRLNSVSDLETYDVASSTRGELIRRDSDPQLLVLRGSKVEYDPGHVLVNGQRTEEPYIAEPPRYAMAPVKLAPRNYLMLGDNRNASDDGHVWGTLTRERFIGRAEVLFWPLERVRVIHWWLLIALGVIFVFYRLVMKLWDSMRPRRRAYTPAVEED
jgi:signal peptidase I